MAVWIAAFAVIACLSACSGDSNTAAPDRDAQPEAAASSTKDSISPRNWPPEELAAYLSTLTDQPMDLVAAAGMKTSGPAGIVTSVSVPAAVHAGVKALQAGGSAMDAALTTALTQNALFAGGPFSYAGHFSLSYFDAAAGKVHALDATYAVPAAENDAMSIPPYGTPHGRGVLVPGFMAGVEAAHARFGKLPFFELLQPSIYFAEEGFEISTAMATVMDQRSEVLLRRPEGREIFLAGDGSLLGGGERLAQPELAALLKNVAADGAAYMYTGPWAEKFVEAVRAEGGRITMEDMRSYRPRWHDDLPGAGVASHTLFGWPAYQRKFHLMERAGLDRMGHYAQSGEALYWMMKIYRLDEVLGGFQTNGLDLAEIAGVAPELARVLAGDPYSDEATALLWETMRQPAWGELEALARAKRAEELAKVAESIEKLSKDFRRDVEEDRVTEDEADRPGHTAGVVAIDADGNMAALTHSVTSAVWGELGIFIDGVSVTDPASFLQQAVAAAGPGGRIGASLGFVGMPLAVQDGRVDLGCGSAGISGQLNMFQMHVDRILYGLSGVESIGKPKFHDEWNPLKPVHEPVGGPGHFRREVLLEAQALGLDVVPEEELARAAHGGVVNCAAHEADGIRRGFNFLGTAHANPSTQLGALGLAQAE